MKALLISSAGGHYSELRKIKLDTKYRTYIVSEKTKNQGNTSIDYYMIYSTRSQIIKYLFISIINVIRSLYIILKVKPDVIISTGAHTCVPFFMFAKIFKIKSIYIESYAKVNSTSLTYKIIKRFCTKIIVQHKTMLEHSKNSEYFGGIY